MSYEQAKRKAVPLMIGLAGTSGSGKTYSALLMAAGIAGENGKVGFLDSELGRGSMYADDVDIMAAMPKGKYYIKEITEPFTPEKYMLAIKEAIAANIKVLVIDSMSHEWEGFGGCHDIAENNKLGGNPNWALAKLKHKRLMNLVTQSRMHIIFCLRAKEKTKQVKNLDTGKMEYIQLGLQPIQEGNFMYEMTLSMMFSDKNPGKPKITKCPKPLLHLFRGEQKIVDKTTGDGLRIWSDTGVAIDLEMRELGLEFRAAANNGSSFLEALHKRIKETKPNLLKRIWTVDFAEELKELAKQADKVEENQNDEEEAAKTPVRLFKSNEEE